jgi:hypothetical protein
MLVIHFLWLDSAAPSDGQLVHVRLVVQGQPISPETILFVIGDRKKVRIAGTASGFILPRRLLQGEKTKPQSLHVSMEFRGGKVDLGDIVLPRFYERWTIDVERPPFGERNRELIQKEHFEQVRRIVRITFELDGLTTIRVERR